MWKTLLKGSSLQLVSCTVLLYNSNPSGHWKNPESKECTFNIVEDICEHMDFNLF